MKKLFRFTAILIVLLAFTSIASAARSEPGAFTVTGYASNVIPTGYPPPNNVFPKEFQPLPNGYFKVHLRNQGGPGVDNDDYCVATYGAPCQDICTTPPPYGGGLPCGVAGGLAGDFVFDEWILLDATMSSGANHGLMTITTAEGQANLRFSGVFGATALKASYEFLGGTGEYRSLKGGGTKAGTPSAVFTVAYTPCGGKDQPACPVNRCALFGDDLKLKKDKAQWTLSNNGESTATISKVMVVWPAGGPQLEKVKLTGKTIYATPAAAPATTIAAGWLGDVKDRQIGAGKQRDLWLEFGGNISALPSDYTILVEFAEGCAVPFVAFP
jgi:hypothetical protein